MSGPTAAIVYDCSNCGAKPGGCKRPWKFEFCYQCEGKNNECELCGGSGVVRDTRCPRFISAAYDTILPFFYEWYAAAQNGNGHTAYPDGRASIKQPIKLKKAFWLLSAYMGFMREKKHGKST